MTASSISQITAQGGIKIVLVIAILILLSVVTKTQGARTQALRRITTFVFALFAIAGIIFPQAISSIASFLGVGRGSDLLLYLLVVAFFAALVVQWRHNVATEQKITQLARFVALLEAREQTTTNQTGLEQPETVDPGAADATA